MSEEQFWRCTPRKINALLRVHAEVNGGNEEDLGGVKKEPTQYIDQVLPLF